MEYQAVVTAVIDGDTFEAIVNLGFNISTKQEFRMAGVRAIVGRNAPGRLAEMIHGKLVTLCVDRNPNNGQYLAQVYQGHVGKGLNVNAWLISNGLAEWRRF